MSNTKNGLPPLGGKPATQQHEMSPLMMVNVAMPVMGGCGVVKAEDAGIPEDRVFVRYETVHGTFVFGLSAEHAARHAEQIAAAADTIEPAGGLVTPPKPTLIVPE